MSEKKTQAIDPDLVRELATILSDTGLTEIEVEHGELRLRIALGAPGMRGVGEGEAPGEERKRCAASGSARSASAVRQRSRRSILFPLARAERISTPRLFARGFGGGEIVPLVARRKRPGRSPHGWLGRSN